MQLHFGIGLLHAEWRRAVACVGTFDGVHRGHQAVVKAAVERAKSEDLPCVLVTFDRHPAAVLAPHQCPKAISPLDENLRALQELGVAMGVVLAFDAELSRMSAQRFLDEILLKSLHASHIVVGHDFAMGNGREGNTEWLQARISTTVVPPFELDDQRVSSTDVRKAVQAGEMEHATLLLGRPFAISGLVVEGQRLGRQLGFPTANIARSFDQVSPKDGVYGGWLTCSRGKFMAAVSMGTRPAVGGTTRTIEAYLLDYPGDSLYGQAVRLELHSRLRDEWYFDTLDALKKQIGKDVEDVRQLLSISESDNVY